MKIKGLNDYGWVTIVNSKDDLGRALVLATSLRRVLTSHSIIALVDNELMQNIRQQLFDGGYDQVYAIEAGKEALSEVLRNDNLKTFKAHVFLPVDSIVVNNCDGILTKDLPAAEWDTATKTSALVISSADSTCHTLDSLTFYSIDCDNSTEYANSLDYVPPIVRLSGVSNTSNANCGLIEKNILKYWKNLYDSDVPPILNGNADEPKLHFSWKGEPISVVGTAECFPASSSINSSFIETTQKGIADAGTSLSCLTSEKNQHSTVILIGSASDQHNITELKKTLEASGLKGLRNLEWISCERKPSSITTLFTAISLFRQYKYHYCLAYYMDNKDRISMLVLKRTSHAIQDDDRVYANMGLACDETKSKVHWTEDSIEISDLIDIVRFMNLNGPMIDKSWLELVNIGDTDCKESAVIQIPQNDNSREANAVLVVTTCHFEHYKKLYPKFSFDMVRPLQCFALQANSSWKLDKLVESYKTLLLQGQTYTNSKLLANLAYTTNTTCVNVWESQQLTLGSGSHRAVIIGKDSSEVCKLISTKGYVKDEPNTAKHKLCFLFTGQGSQYPGMAKALYDNCPVFRVSFDACNAIFRNMYNINIHDVIWKNSAELSRTLYSQTAIFCVEYALLQVWKSWGVEPDFVIGHSLGEFSAAVAAGALDLSDALKLVAERSRLIDNLPRGKMLVLRGDELTISRNLQEYSRTSPGAWLDFAAVNSKDQTVLSGDSGYVEEFSKFATAKKISNMVLEATHAFHSRHMDPMLDAYREVAQTCKGELMPTKCTYISGMDGKVFKGPLNPDYWVRHTRERVRFVQASKAAYQEGCRVFVEVGPQPILSAMVKVNNSTDNSLVFLPSIRRGIDDWKTILTSLAKLWAQGRRIDWTGVELYYDREKVAQGVISDITSF